MNGQNQGNDIGAAADEARSTLSETAEKVKDAATQAGAKALDMTADVGAKAQEYAREAGQQASAAAASAYGVGNEALDLVEGLVRENPWTALLLAGAAGYGLACLVKQQTR